MHSTPSTPCGTSFKLALAAAAVAGLVMATQAEAQNRIDTGNVSDANPRVGSGGFNTPARNPFEANLANDIVYGNITGGREFQGPVASTDPRAFRGPTTDIASTFIRESSGINSFNANTVQRFFGEERAVEPPAGFVELTGVGGYVPDRTIQTRTAFDNRLGYVLPDQTIDNTALTPEELRLGSGGPMSQTLASEQTPFLGFTDEQRQRALSAFTVLGDDLAPGVDRDRLDRMRDELLGADEALSPDGMPDDDGDSANDPLDSQVQEQPLDGNVRPQVDAEVDAQVNLGVQTDAGTRDNAGRLNTRLGVDTQYDALSRRLEGRLGRDVARPEVPEVAGEDDAAQDEQPPEVAPPQAEEMPEPPTVTDLGQGVQPRGLKQVFDEAQTALDEGRYADAASLYDTATRLDRGNGFAMLGRAVADLGGGYYRLAAQEMEGAYRADPALLMGKYDLRELLGDDRLGEVTEDLKRIVQVNEDDPSPAFLLAVIQYNAGDERLASGFLDLAERRDGDNAFYKQVRELWQLEDVK